MFVEDKEEESVTQSLYFIGANAPKWTLDKTRIKVTIETAEAKNKARKNTRLVIDLSKVWSFKGAFESMGVFQIPYPEKRAMVRSLARNEVRKVILFVKKRQFFYGEN